MGARRFLNEILVISPVMLIAGITVHARTHVDPFESPEYSARQNHRIAAYVEPVRLVEQMTSHGTSLADPVRVRLVGQTWRNLSLQGVLTPLPPEFAEDSSREGVKSQIRTAGDELAAALQFLALENLREDRPFEAACDAVLAMEAIQGFKYSDLYSTGMFAVRENASLELIGKCAPRLSVGQKAEIAERLAELRRRAVPLSTVVLYSKRAALGQEGAASQMPRPEFELALALAKEVDDESESPRLGALLDQLSQDLARQHEQSMLLEFRFALNATRNVKRDWSALAVKLG